jgi:amino acid adenylation domain-containing protein
MIAREGFATTDTPVSAGSSGLAEKRARAIISPMQEAPAIGRCAPQGNAPLSFAQQRLWFLDQLAPGSPVYNIPEAIRLVGALSLPALENSFAEILRRHQALRTTFQSTNGQPVQVVTSDYRFSLALCDLSHLGEAARQEEIQRLAVAEARKPFDLTRDLMLRASLVRLAPEEHVLFITMHHIASDAWSIGILYGELATLYRAFLEGKNPAEAGGLLPELPIQYPDYATWQRQWLDGQVLEEQLTYWKNQLAGAPDLLELPIDKPRPAVQSFRGGARSMLLPRELARDLKALSRREGVTLFMLLLGAFKVLLSRYSRQQDILVGSPIAGRTQVETEGLIGFFINTLILRTDLSGNPTFKQLLQKIRKITLDAYAHQDLPLEKLVMELKPERSSSHTPLFQVVFVLQSAPSHPPELTNLSATYLEVDTETAKFDLILSITDTPQGLKTGFEYNVDLFEESTIARMLEHFRTLLEGIAAAPEQRISQLPLLPAPERRLLLEEWNEAKADYPREKTIHQLFDEQAARTPNAVAILDGQEQTTYAQLAARANQLAHHLQSLGVAPDTGIGVYLERSTDLVVALLAILKAGGAYVPLDRSYPRERLSFMIQDAGLGIIITQGSLQSPLPEFQGTLVRLDQDQPQIGKLPATSPLSATQASQLAYIIYTSGSTGKPKGTCIPHRGVTRLVINANYARLDSTDVLAQISNVSFDAATWEIWGALLNGARLVILSKDTFLSPKAFGDAIRAKGITGMFLTSALFNQMARENPEGLNNLRHLIFGGEIADPKSVQEVLAKAPATRLVNAYGPTETTTFALCHQIHASDGSRSVPIGKPISNTEIYVLDQNQQPVPLGVPGELHIGGDGLARGYLNRPELTAEKFIPHPFKAHGDARLYKTGDLVRFLPSGDLDFISRIDFQVKIRGFRVELGEIENVLTQHPAVKQCIVIARADGPALDKRLVAYCVIDHAKISSISALREHLLDKLPDYMVPAFFVRLEELPLTPNGKVNRAALPAPETTSAEAPEKILPRNATEQQLVRIWENVLGVNPVGLRDNFFELGGHSLLAVQLVAQIEKNFGKKLSVSTIFQYRTVEQLSRLLREEGMPMSGSSIVEIQSKGSRPPLVFVHGVGGGMFWGYTNLSHCLGQEQPVYALKSRGMDGEAEFATIEEMAAHYVADLRAFQPKGPYYLGGYCFGGVVAFEMAQQLMAQGQEVAMLALINCGPPNSSYSRFRWTPLLTAKFLKNLLYWAGNSLRWKPEQRREFIQWKWRVVQKRWSQLFGAPKATKGRKMDVETFVDLSAYPEDQQKLWQTHIMALMNYHPKPYHGHITLFRSKGHQLFCSFDQLYGWGEFARQGVTVRVVACPHEGILEEPHVQRVASQLQELLGQTTQTQTVLKKNHLAPAGPQPQFVLKP